MKLSQSAPVMLLLALLSLGGQTVYAEHDYQQAEINNISVHADIRQHPDCRQCGMDRDKFSSSRMLITYADGSTVATCSLTCVVTEMKHNPGKAIASVQVADYVSKRMIDARKAFWVLGGKKHGVMTDLAKWAFSTRKGAEMFVLDNGGRVAGYDEALAAARKESD